MYETESESDLWTTEFPTAFDSQLRVVLIQ